MLGNFIQLVSYCIMAVTNQHRIQEKRQLASTTDTGWLQYNTSECPCLLTLHPVCGTDTRTYVTECVLNCAKKYNPELEVAYNGSCFANYPPSTSSGGLSVPALIEVSKQIGVPFSQSSLNTLKFSNRWWAIRAFRMTNVVIFNKSQKTFNLTSSDCTHGMFSISLYPERWIIKKQSVAFGLESYGFLIGLECNVKYRSDDGSYFEIDITTPFLGTNRVYENHTSELNFSTRVCQGYDNQVRILIEDKLTHS